MNSAFSITLRRGGAACRRLLALGLLLAGAGLAASGLPSKGAPEDFFGLTNLYEMHLTIAADQWALMNQTDTLKPNAQRPGANNGPRPFQPGQPPGGGPGMGPMMGIDFQAGTAKLEFQGQAFGEIRVRFKGNSSFRAAGTSLKCSLKLDFNDLKKGQTFFGLTKLNLNNNAMDPSQMREALAYDIFRVAGVPAGRTAFVKVFVTVPGRHQRAYAGLYTAVEQVDERFLKARLGAKEGLLLKPERFPGLPYLGDRWEAYTNGLQPKTAASTNDARRFIEFVKWLNQTSDEQFRAAAADYVEIDEYLRFLAVEGLLANMDSPLMTGHNYYLFLHPGSRKFLWIPWDLNEAFGGFLAGGSLAEQMNLSVDRPYTQINRIAERLLQAPDLKERYHGIVRGILATNFSAARLHPLIDAMAAVIRPALAEDPQVTLAQFESAISAAAPSAAMGDRMPGQPGAGPGGMLGMRRPRTPLKTFVTQRAASAQRQLSGSESGHVPREMRPGGPGLGGPNPPGQPW